jgi:hypothetical protein
MKSGCNCNSRSGLSACSIDGPCYRFGLVRPPSGLGESAASTPVYLRVPLLAASIWLPCAWASAQAPDEPAARLVYERGVQAERCPEESELRAAVTAQLGYAVFEREPVTREMHVRIAAVSSGLVARIEVKDPSGAVLGARELRSPARDCNELASALALAISMALDPARLMAEDPPARSPLERCPTCPVCPAAVPVDIAASPSTLQTTALTLEVGLGGGLGLGALPEPSLALIATLVVRMPRALFALEGVVHPGVEAFPGPAPDGPDAISASLLLGRVAACLAWPLGAGGFGVCGVGGLGTLRSEGLSTLVRDSSLSADAGVRVLWDLQIASDVSIQPRADLRAGLTRTTLVQNDAARWTSPGVFGELSIVALMHFR